MVNKKENKLEINVLIFKAVFSGEINELKSYKLFTWVIDKIIIINGCKIFVTVDETKSLNDDQFDIICFPNDK